MAIKERIIVVETLDEREVVIREPAAELETWRGCGPERGEWEDEARRAEAEYLPPQTA